jgi:hypothetical protein
MIAPIAGATDDGRLPLEVSFARCSAISVALGEQLAGTVGYRPGWVLLEQPGPWGADALTHSRLDPLVGANLEARASELGLRVVLIRRHGRAEPGTAETPRVPRVDGHRR